MSVPDDTEGEEAPSTPGAVLVLLGPDVVSTTSRRAIISPASSGIKLDRCCRRTVGTAGAVPTVTCGACEGSDAKGTSDTAIPALPTLHAFPADSCGEHAPSAPRPRVLAAVRPSHDRWDETTRPRPAGGSGARSCVHASNRPAVEARGVEPRSEVGSTTASTCIARRSGSPETGRRAADPRTSPHRFRPAPEGTAPDYPDIAILMKPPRAGFRMSRCMNA